MMNDARVMTMEELAAFLETSDAVTFKGRSREENYAWIEGTLRRYAYASLPRAQKGMLRRYLEKMTGYSQAQLSRLIAQYRRTGHVRLAEYQRHRFPTNYSRADQALLAEVDNAHSRLSGPATQAILRRGVRSVRPEGVRPAQRDLRGTPLSPAEDVHLPPAQPDRTQDPSQAGAYQAQEAPALVAGLKQ